MSEIPAERLEIVPTQFRTFCVALGCGVSKDGKFFVMTAKTPDGGSASLEFPFEAIDDIVAAIRQTQQAVPSKLIVPDVQVPADLNGGG